MIRRTAHIALLASAIFVASGAQAQAANEAAPAKPVTGDQTDGPGGDIIVTASKRPERQLDVPSAITAFRGTDLVDRGYTSFKDYLALTPGVQVNQNGGGGTPIVRGLTTGTNLGALVGIVVDGAPVGPSSSFALGGANSTDLDPIDLKRVEILKGPQGTLYGANTLGGLISYTFARPSLTSFNMIARGELSETEHGDVNYSLRGAVSAPLVSDQLAVRVSGYVDRPSGFIDNSVTGVQNQNRQRNWGINGALRFEPAPNLTISLVGFHQKVDQPAQDYVLYGADHRPLTQSLHYDQGLSDSYHKTTDAVIGTIDYNLGFASLTSVTSYQHIDTYILINQNNGQFATTLPFLALLGGQAVPAGTLVGADAYGATKKFTQEVRLTSSGDGPLQYVVGGFYTHERTDDFTDVVGLTPAHASIPGLNPALGFGVNDTYEEVAGFGNLTYEFSSQFDVTGGIRVGGIHQSYGQTFFGGDTTAFNTLLALSGLSAVPADTGLSHGSETVKSYLATARYHFSPSGMLYLRYATGFRPGGPNFSVPGLPATFNSDSTQNFEGGVKSKFWGGRGTIDVSAFYTRWNDILIQVSSGGLNGYANGGRARVYGVEGALSLRPLAGLSFAGTFAYNDGKITEIDPLAIGAVGVGDPLPNSAKWSGSLSADYRAPLNDEWTAVANATGKFVGARHSALRSSLLLVDYVMPAYSLFDASVGAENRHLAINLFVRNLTDARAQTSAATTPGLNEVIIQRPRTIGVSLTVKY